MTWFYSKNGQQLGPITEQEFARKFTDGEILPTDLVWKEGMSDWIPRAQVVSSPLPAKIISVPPLHINPPSNAGSSFTTQPPAIDAKFIPPSIPNYQWQSIVALVLACIQTLIICVPISLVFAIVAVVYATKVDNYQLLQNHFAAADASKNAKVWMIVSFCTSIPIFLGILGIMIWVFYNLAP
ncbi:MAG: GYF domain-containing protein [Verrucomicrobiota bacterium]